MNKYLVALTFLLLYGSLLLAKTFQCQNEEQKKITLVAELDTAVPFLMEVSNTGVKTLLIAKDELCGVRLNFSTACSSQHNKKSQYKEYSFRCDDLFGDFLYSEEQGSEIEFRCFGDSVPIAYQHKLYSQCTY